MIYESDIIHMGGMIDYSGHIIVKSSRSTLQHATLCVNSMKMPVQMERFRDGTAVVVSFGDDLESDQFGVPHSERFLDILQNIKEQEPIFEEFLFFRQLKQVGLGVFQFVIFCILILNFISWFRNIYVLSSLIISVISLLLLLLSGKCYSLIRCEKFDDFNTFLYRDKP